MTPARPLAGIRVVDFTWVRAGPWAARWLAVFGADVIKVEWPEHLDPFRRNQTTVPPGVEPGPNSSGTFADQQVNKRGITLNVRTPRGMELIQRLISVSDIVIENFSSRVMQRWGLGYDEMKRLNPAVVYVSMAGFGQTGRHHGKRKSRCETALGCMATRRNLSKNYNSGLRFVSVSLAGS